MTNEKKLTTDLVHPASLGKRMVQGAGIAFTVITIFLLGAGESSPYWGRFWMIKPLIIVPLAGALGGAFYYCMDYLRFQGGADKVMASFLSLIIYIFGLFLGIVLGLDGTLWD